MNSFSNRNGVFLLSAIMAFVATALFVVVPVTITFLIAYIFTILAIVMFCGGNLYMLANPKSYPWFAVFPMTIWQYFLAQLALSFTFVIREIFFAGLFHIGLFLFLHILLLAVFAVRLLLIKSGKETVETKDAEIKQKISAIRMMQADVESLTRQYPEYNQQLKQVAEALRYSDPISLPSASLYDEQIQLSIFSMTGTEGNDPANIPQICETLLRQIANRNSKVKLMK
ncbi:MAG: hypothetical protein FWB91_10560 [Defluviitaleaceae bacterium]|nr:hypothetical protein [Defluviitaleaceae bacterium]